MSSTPDQGPPMTTPPADAATPPTPTPKKRSGGGLMLLIAVLLVLIAGGAFAYVYYTEFSKVEKINFSQAIRTGILNPDKLDAKLTDADGDLVADAPKDAKEQIDPEVLLVGTLDSDPKKAEATWKGLLAYLTEKTGKKTQLVQMPTGGQGVVEMMKADKPEAHVAFLSTGTVPLAVNQAGFVPVVVPADDQGKFGYRMEIIVPAASAVKATKDLKGKKVSLTSLGSFSSFRAPVEYLHREHGYLPGRDYEMLIASGQAAAIEDVCRGKTDAAAVASDFLARTVAEPERKLKDDMYRKVYESDAYPPFCVGYHYRLKPEVAAKVAEALAGYSWDPALKAAYAKAGQTKFVKVTYKKDWEGVRKADQALREMVEKNTK